MTNSIYQRILKSEFLKNVSTVIVGITIGQLISILFAPIIGRIYDAKIFGEYGIILSTGGIVAGFLDFGLTPAIMTQKDDDDAKAISTIVIVISFGILLVLFTTLYIISSQFKLFDITINYTFSLIYLFIYLHSLVIYGVFYQYLNRKKIYRVMFFNPIIGSTANVIITIILSYTTYKKYGLLLGALIANVLNILHMRMHINPVKYKIEKSKLLYLIKSNRGLYIYQLPANILQNISMQIPAQLLSRLYGNVMLGYYTQCQKYIEYPIKFLARPINIVYYKKISEDYNNKNDFGNFTFKLINSTIIFALIPTLIFILFGNSIFSIFLGSNWSQSGTFASILGINALMLFIGNSLSYGIVVIKKSYVNLITSLLSIIINYSLMMMAHSIFKSPYIMMTFYSIANTMIMIVYQGYYLNNLQFNLKQYVRLIVLKIILPVIIVLLIKIVFIGF